MSNTNKASLTTKLKTGIFTLVGLLFMGGLTIFVNNRPFWWRPCSPVQITVEDATGLKMKAPVKSLGLEIGYVSDIGLVKDGVKLRVCVTAPVEIVPDTKAYVRSEGFLGDRFLELKPVKYIGDHTMEDAPSAAKSPAHSSHFKNSIWDWVGLPSASAQESENSSSSAPATTKNIPVGEKSTDMQALMSEMKNLTTSLKEAINPEEIRGTIRQLNKTLEDASRALSPQGGLTQTAQRSLVKLEDAIEQMRDQMTRINQGQGSVGMLLNDPTYADELKKALLSVNKLLGRANELRLQVNLGINQLPAYNATRAAFQVYIFPKPDRYYLVGIDSDPRGKISQITNTNCANGSCFTNVNTTTDKGGYVFTAMLGKVLKDRLDVAIGILHGDGAAALGINLGPDGNREELQAKGELYFRSQSSGGNWTAQPDGRIYLNYQPISIFYLTGGVEGFRHVNGNFSSFYGAGVRFDDDDIKLLISFL